jgi:Na+/proline symporter
VQCACAAMSFLIPIGVVVYAAIGGLKATFTTSYMHTVIIFVLCLIFMFKVYVPGDLLGGIDDVRSTWPTDPPVRH